jgi:hypothetical protein
VAERLNAHAMKKFNSKELGLIGAILYSCEGTRLRKDKRRKNDVYYWVIEFTNSNFNLVAIFLDFLRKVIKINNSRLKGQLFVYDDTKRQELEKRWSKITGIPLVNFNKTIVLKAKNSKYKPNPFGTFKVRYHSKEAFQKLNSIIAKVLE